MAGVNLAIRHFLYARLTVESIFTILGTDMTLLPDGTSAPAPAACAADDMAGACRVVADYSAGMTGCCTIEAYRRLTDLSSPG
ncbi:hypothetical protein ACM0P6_12415 [Komagataeibacter sucrofermentans]|uniref:hypothetical protein n=1 Tax=Komagataeibacter sucrofermentans TaxID=1053551 RepID=UPI001FC9B141|nr:hypothetical protein [Komagataeibacter sucrofermentans]GBQ45089.1 hypothetical protein AA15973_0498 [Komagataeibacter sucrofermentans DSM 15973]